MTSAVETEVRGGRAPGALPSGAYDQIRQGIVEGRYAPGSRLIEQRLAEELELSRTPVREALRRLEAEGLVVSERNRGSVVRPVTARDVEDLYDLRVRLESLAAERAAERAAPADLAELAQAVEDFDAAVPGASAGDVDGVRRLAAANRRFHDGVLAAAGNDRLSRMLAGTVDLPLVFQALRRFGRPEHERSALFHRLILAAIVARAPDRAGRLMTEHVLQGRDALLLEMTSD